MPKAKPKATTDDRRVAVYARKSKITEMGRSIEIQKEKCISLACAQFDVAADDVLVYEDEGRSGFYADRPQYKKMLRDIEHDKIRAVICYKIDRISRRTIDLLSLIQQMEQKGIAFVSVSDRELFSNRKLLLKQKTTLNNLEPVEDEQKKEMDRVKTPPHTDADAVISLGSS